MDTSLTPRTASISTDWHAVMLIIGSGIAASLQVGKVAIATPLIQQDMSVGLAAAGWLMGIFSFLGLLGGMPVGTVVAAFGHKRILLAGLGCLVLGAILGALAPGFTLLLVSRVVEGAGFLIIIVAAPAILPYVVDTRHQALAFAMWSCFMPGGMALAMLVGPWFEAWRILWWGSAVIAAIMALGVMLAVPAAAREDIAWHGKLRDMLDTLRTPAPLVLAGVFAFYNLMFFALFSFLPILLMERMAVSHQAAGALSALATSANILGNLAAGTLLARGVGRVFLLAAASLIMGVTGLGIFLSMLPALPTFLLCMLFLAVGGLIPATLLASAPIFAPRTVLTPLVVGLLMQGSNLGQVIGPVAIGDAIEWHGWTAAGLIVAAVAILTAMLAQALRRPHMA